MSRTIKKQLPELNWTKARDALDALTANGEDPNAAMESLATYLRLGKLRAQAKQADKVNSPSIIFDLLSAFSVS